MRRILGRHPIALLALLAVLAGVVLAPRLARPVLERQLTRALGTPVRITSLSWKPIRGIISAEKVVVGPPERLLVIGRITCDFMLQSLARGAIAFDSIELADVIGQADLDRDLELRVRGLEAVQDRLAAAQGALRPQPATAAPPPGAPSARTAPAVLPEIATDRITIEHVRLVVHDVSRSPAHRVTVDLDRFETAPFSAPLDASRLDLHADFHGALDDRPEASKTTAGKEGESLAAKLGGVLSLRRDAPSGRDEARLELDVKDLSVSGPLDTLLSSSKVSIAGLHLDLARQEVSVARTQVDDLHLRAAFSPDGVVLPVPTWPRAANPPAGARPWRLATGPVELRTGTIELGHGEKPFVVIVDSGYWGGFEPGGPRSLQAKLIPAIGGSATLEGRAGVAPPGADVRVKLSDVPVPALAALVPGNRLQFSRGTTGGELDVVLGGARQGVHGDLWAAGLLSVPPSPDHPEEVLACNRIAASLTIDPSSPGQVEIASMSITDPYVMVRRREAGLFPLSLLAPVASGPADTSSSPPLDVHVARVEVSGARGEFYDTLVRPSYWTSLGEATATIANLHLPDATIESFDVAGKLDEISPLEAKGRLDAQGLHATSQVEQLHLPPLNPYVSPALAYTLDSGLLTMTSEIDISRASFRASNDLVLSRLGLSPAGDDFFARDLGVPLTIALALMKDYQGRIALSVPVEGELGTSSFHLGSVLLQAVKRALLGLLQAPIRLLGSLFGTRGAPDAFAIDPIPFAPGASTLDGSAQARVDQIGQLLAAHPDLQLVLKAQLAPADATALRIAALRDRLEPRSGVSNGAHGNAHDGSAADVKALEPLRPLLSSKGDGREHAALENELARLIPFPAEGLRGLGNARALAAESALAPLTQGSAKADGRRLVIVPAAPTSETELDRAPGVYAELRAD